MVPGHAQRCPLLDHSDDQSQNVRCVRTAVDEISEEDGPTTNRGRDGNATLAVLQHGRLVTKAFEQLHEFVVAAVNVSDDVERSALGAPVGPEALARDRGRVDLFDGRKRPDIAQSLSLQTAHRPTQLLGLLAHDVGTEVAVRSGTVALLRYALRQVEDDRHRQHVVRAGELDQRLARLGLHVRGVDHRELHRRQALGSDEVQQLERVLRGGLVVRVIGHGRTTPVRGEDLRRLEVLRREGRLA